MKIQTYRTKLKQPVCAAGLIKGHVEFTISNAESSVEWTGPKISPELWVMILEFFRDTNVRTHSECQVRLYVSTKEGKWAAWAFPQEARTGMSAREIDNDAAKEQRAMFKDEEGWIYAGTVHHHCNSGAFQSATDHANEKPQDGLHMTIGKLNDAHWDIHCRFYFDGLEYAPDMSLFWDITDTARALLPKEFHDKCARHQMTVPPPFEATYPEQWKANLIEPPPAPSRFEENLILRGANMAEGTAGNKNGNGGNANGGGCSNERLYYKGYGQPDNKRIQLALDAVFDECRKRGLKDVETAGYFKLLEGSIFLHALKNEAGHHRVLVWDILNEWARQRDEQEARDSLAQNCYGV